MNRLLKTLSLLCLAVLLCSQVAFCRAEVRASNLSDRNNAANILPLESVRAPLEYLQYHDNRRTLSHLKILEIYPDIQKSIDSDVNCIAFRAEVIQDLLDVLEPGSIMLVELIPHPSQEDKLSDILAAGKEHLASIDSCFVYGGWYDLQDWPIEDASLYSGIDGTIVFPDIGDGGFLPVVDERVDTEALESIWEFPLEKYDRCIPNARNMEQLLTILEGHTDPDYHENSHEQLQQNRAEYERATMLIAIGIIVLCSILIIDVLRKRS